MHQEKIREILAQYHINVPADHYQTALSDFGLDSLKMALIIIALEQAFQINISLSTMTPERFNSITSINQLIEENLAS